MDTFSRLRLVARHVLLVVVMSTFRVLDVHAQVDSTQAVQNPPAASRDPPPPPKPVPTVEPTLPADVPAPPSPQVDSSVTTAQSAPAGQWVYTDQYGWVWMPYAQEY